MFESVTKRRKNPLINIFGWTLLTVVCVVFIFIGFSPNSSFLGQGGAAAEVNGEAISLREYKTLLDQIDANSQGEKDREAQRRIREQTINTLVSRSLIVQEANKMNFFVSDNRVAQKLLDIEPFYEDGVFSRLKYKNYLRYTRQTEAQFEDKIRKDEIIQKMSRLIGYAAKEVPLMDSFDEKIDQAQINVGYVKISPDVAKSNGNVSVEKYLEDNQDKVKKYFDTHKSEYAQPERVKARHILVKTKDQSKESLDQAFKKMQEIKAKTTVENFAEMAKKHSDDPGSKEKGGDLGFFPRGRMVPEFDKMAFSSEPGQITDPVKTKFGYHILLVEEKTPAQEKSFDDVKTTIAKKLMQEEAYDNMVTEVKSLLKDEKYTELEDYLQKNNLTWKDTGFFNITRENVPGVGQNKEFLDQAMTLGTDKEYGKNLVYQGTSAFLMKFKGAKIDATAKANSQMDFFKQLMKKQKMDMLVQNWINDLRKESSVKINPDLVQ